MLAVSALSTPKKFIHRHHGLNLEPTMPGEHLGIKLRAVMYALHVTYAYTCNMVI